MFRKLAMGLIEEKALQTGANRSEPLVRIAKPKKKTKKKTVDLMPDSCLWYTRHPEPSESKVLPKQAPELFTGFLCTVLYSFGRKFR